MEEKDKPQYLRWVRFIVFLLDGGPEINKKIA